MEHESQKGIARGGPAGRCCGADGMHGRHDPGCDGDAADSTAEDGAARGERIAGGDGEQVLLQGVVDCFFEEDGQLVLLDFKTDRVRAGEEEAAAAGYREQLEAYAYALRRITGKPVREKAVFFLRTGCAVYMQDRKFF